MYGSGGFRITPFESSSGGGKSRRTARERVRTLKMKRARKRTSGMEVRIRPMLIKIGVCAAACAAVLLLEMNRNGVGNTALTALEASVGAYSADGAEETDEGLGKLRFVELPGIIEVFAPDAPRPLPIEAEEAKSEEDGLLLVLSSGKEQRVEAGMAGSIKDAGTDEKGVGYAVIADSSGRELSYSGLSEVTVERGQIVSASDHIGSLESGGELRLRLYRKGSPVELDEFFDLKRA